MRVLGENVPGRASALPQLGGRSPALTSGALAMPRIRWHRTCEVTPKLSNRTRYLSSVLGAERWGQRANDLVQLPRILGPFARCAVDVVHRGDPAETHRRSGNEGAGPAPMTALERWSGRCHEAVCLQGLDKP
ncbi:hypothetical protein RHA1_ro11192 (plasmid) [Rhodococcus jostii RHA1]|uniref:Uncharacterized protein n=1 Tax=Rhodococcus jostii (strain RHA1) TaxID=101510 RepID=Q0RV47_RHOJR|nr:hypothetical protein RHA1_ro11192 [Rhodococcus jostii RHA1]